MGKNRPLPRSAYVRGPTLGADGRMAGSWIRPRSTDPNVLVVHSLDVWDASMGTLYGGTLYAGPNARGASPPRVIIGDAANGLQVYDDGGILCASISWRNGSGRFGRLGTPGITWANGNMHIDGDAIVDGTVRANKLAVGDTAYTFLEQGRLVVGYGYLSTMAPDDLASLFTGFVAQTSGVGGLNKGRWTWYVDQYTGAIVSAGPRGWPVDGAKISDGQIELAALINENYDRPTIIFTTYAQLESGEFGVSASAYLQSAGPALLLTSPEGGPSYMVHDGAWGGVGSGATYSSYYWSMQQTDSNGSVVSEAQFSIGPVGQSLQVGSDTMSFLFMNSYSAVGFVISPTQPSVMNAALGLYHGSAAETYAEGSIEWDAATHTPRVWDGAAWQTLAFVA